MHPARTVRALRTMGLLKFWTKMALSFARGCGPGLTKCGTVVFLDFRACGLRNCCHFWTSGLTWELHCLGSWQSWSSSADTRTTQRVTKNQGIGTPQGGSAIYLRASRANHSCQPNAAFQVSKTGHLRLVTLRPVECKDEILVSYLPEGALLRPGAKSMCSGGIYDAKF